MANHEQWFISDTHFFHANILKFTNDKGVRTRHEFQNMDQMHSEMVRRWNSVVGVNDYVYHLGDVTFQYHRPFQELMYSLNGNKRLIVGNHDKLKQEGLTKHFEKVMLWHGFREANFTAVHIPLEQWQLRDGKYCVHGHIHRSHDKRPHCINMSVEVRDYTPVHIEQIIKEINAKEAETKNT